MKVLIVGAQPDSLGAAIAGLLNLPGENVNVVTAGISEREEISLDITHPHTYRRALVAGPYDHVIVTAGLNVGYENYTDNLTDWMEAHMQVNCIGPMNLFQTWYKHARAKSEYNRLNQFIVVSSNSAHIARSNSMAYCASKAAMSMSVRVAAREIGREAAADTIIYGYEPGLLAGTPMTKDTERRFGPSQTRIPGAEGGLDRYEVARQIVATMRVGTWAMNGVLVRLDGGEQ
jgi:NAD(P)-dependent dehydrogenase (short-subunit alcohol dehydrogenase family)